MSDCAGAAASVACAAASRTPGVLIEPLARKPYDLFIARMGDLRWVGRKQATSIDGERDAIKCCLIDASMVAGLFEQARVDADGVTLYFRPIDDRERAVVFDAFVGSVTHELEYPFTRVISVPSGGFGESTAPPEYWNASPDRASEFDIAELPLRRHAVTVLRRHGITSGLIYDPACSTGAFLAHVKRAIPRMTAIGQDASLSMVELAATRALDEVHHGDSVEPAVKPGSVDVLVLRHLNFDVVTTSGARALLAAALATVKRGGLVLAMGHTPLLVTRSEFERTGLCTLESIGVTPGPVCAFQFYVMRASLS